jgi:hypothetical protein
MKGKKALFLFLALLLPVGIFIFLRIFGKNQFDVAPLHQEGIIEMPASCNLKYTAPYTVPDSVMNMINTGNTSLAILNFSKEDSVLQRVLDEVGETEIRIMSPSTLASLHNIDFIKSCILLLKAPYDIVLIDDQKRIRGYYKASDREEIDRLIIELNIILKKY